MNRKIDLQTTLLWGCILLLLGASLFYGVSVEKMRRNVFNGEGKIDNGGIVSLLSIIDGDTVRAAQEGRQPALIRILGIKAFESGDSKNVVSTYGKASIDTLRSLTQNMPVRVLLHSTPKDRHGRYIATLYVDDQDIGLRLIKEGLAVVYTVYPFPAMSFYLQEQITAREGRRGLWANADAESKALSLFREFQGRSQQ